MRRLEATLAILLLAASVAPLRAQLPISLDISGGPVRASGSGAGGAGFVSLTFAGLHARLGGEVLRAGASAAADSSLRTYASSAGIGLIMPGLLIPRPYALIIGGQGVDWRENDHFRSLGVAAGVRGILSRFSVEVRYERLFQHGPQHQDLPSDMIGAFVGAKVL